MSIKLCVKMFFQGCDCHFLFFRIYKVVLLPPQFALYFAAVSRSSIFLCSLHYVGIVCINNKLKKIKQYLVCRSSFEYI